MIVLHYSKSFAALDRYVQGYNTSQEALKDRIRQNTYSTAKEIIRLYGKALIKAHIPKEAKPGDFPPLTTNNVQLAKLTQSSSRTIQRHLKQLLQAGILQEKNWKGRKANYELWINPLLLLTTAKTDPIQAQLELHLLFNQKTEKEGVTNFKTTNCPPSETGNIGNINNIVIGVDKSFPEDRGSVPPLKTSHATQRRSPSFTVPLSTSYETRDTTRDTGENRPKKIEEAGENRQLRAGQNQELNAPKSSPERTASLSFYVQLLWILAKKLLYKDRFLTERQEHIALELLIQWYEPVPDLYLSEVHQIYLERIGLVRKYLNKNPQRFVPLPYIYFDPQNADGFAGTKAWYYKSQARKKEVRKNRILNNQVQRFLNNSKQSSSTRKPPLLLYQECQKRVEELNDPPLLKQFHQSVLNPSTPIEFNI